MAGRSVFFSAIRSSPGVSRGAQKNQKKENGITLNYVIPFSLFGTNFSSLLVLLGHKR